jgi:hypothetical protein
MRLLLGIAGVALSGAIACHDDHVTAETDANPSAAGVNGNGSDANGEAGATTNPEGSRRKIRPPIAPPSPQNSLDTVDPNFVIPNAAALVPRGVMGAEDIPNTLDLAEMAALFLEGITKTLLPETPYFFVPPGMVNMHGTPTSIFAGGAPNWGKAIQAMVMARRMSGYDLDDAKGTLTRQLASTRNMIDPNVNRNLIGRGEGAWHVVTGANPENQMTTTVEALMELYDQSSAPDLGQLIQQMVAYHTKMAIPGRNDDGQPILHYRLPTPGVTPYLPNSIGTLGYGDWPFHVGKTMRALATWNLLVGDGQALESTKLLGTFVRGYSNGVFWSVPPGFPEGAGTGHFAGHVHMFANGLMGLLWEAEARLQRDRSDPVAPALIDFVKQSYFFVRDMHGGASSALGNFGEICALADMLRLAVKLTELGAGDFNEDIDRWTRNQLAESQIRGAITIASHPGEPLRDRIGEKVIGLFFEDATHALAIPDTLNDQGSLTLQLVACGLGNVVHAIYDVWKHIVELKGKVAQVNLLLNKATPHLDVTSEVPFRGAVHVTTRADLGPVTTLEVRIPDGVDPAQVHVATTEGPISYDWAGARYARVANLRPSTRYTITFPLTYVQLGFKQVRNQSQNWAESSHTIDPGTGQDYGFHENAPENVFSGVFRGNTLVAVDHWPSGGIRLYQGADRAYWRTLGAADAPSTPTHRSGRFRLEP